MHKRQCVAFPKNGSSLPVSLPSCHAGFSSDSFCPQVNSVYKVNKLFASSFSLSQIFYFHFVMPHLLSKMQF